jgi:hypothetical protein
LQICQIRAALENGIQDEDSSAGTTRRTVEALLARY